MADKLSIAWISAFFLLFFAHPCLAESLENGDIGERVREPVRESVETRRETQEKNEAWQKEKRALTARYDRLKGKNKRLEAKKASLEKDVAAADRRIARKKKQLADITQITDSINPFLREMIGRIETVAGEGLPFLKQEREQRIERLYDLMEEPDETTSEKYRKVMEALLVEAEYGNTIDVYQETITVSDRTILANIFRLGRISLFYQSLDQQESGWFNVAEDRWEELPKTHNRAISAAIDIGAKRQPVALLTLPLGRMVVK